MTMTNEEKIKKLQEIRGEYTRRMNVLREEQERIVREAKLRLENAQKEELEKALNS